MIGRLGSCAMLALLAACEPPTDPIRSPERRLVIHAVLDAGSGSAFVRVEYIDSDFGHRLVGVGGADVTITAPDGEVFSATMADPQNERVGYPVLIPQVIPGGTYALHVRTQIGEEAAGTTTVPEYASLPLTDFVTRLNRNRDTVSMSWNRVPLAARYEVVVENTIVHEGHTFNTRTLRAFTDTSITIAGTARTIENDFVFFPAHSADVIVLAVDDNYYSYYHLSADPFAGAPPSRLSGAVGVFGAVVPVKKRRYLNVE